MMRGDRYTSALDWIVIGAAIICVILLWLMSRAPAAPEAPE